ncbi:hypothetical protein FB451DRAFT_62538 [Mycena latifolia]|nr:hypothetical protein FB451DRAFT_62538 [Mycena latifolia]
MPKDTSKDDPEAYMKFYPGSGSKLRVPLAVQAGIRKDPSRQATWRALYAADQARKRAEDSGDWTLRLPRELMDVILADPSLGVREHLALAAAAPELRRLYHNSDIWSEILKTRTIPLNGVQVVYDRQAYQSGVPRKLRHLATAPQKKKAHGGFFMALHEPYSLHRVAVRDIRNHRISRAKVAELYPNLTDGHVARLRYYDAVTTGYPNQRRNAGYAEVAVEWLSIRVANGMA